ncbi:MAG TPA: thioredoxin [Gammaproteobacteria bacterium]|nr:thioredoxin [Gammaproteobacteria bacterium]
MNQPSRKTASVRDVTAADFASVVLEGSHERPVLVDFWADWCGPCKMLGPVLERLAQQYGGAFLLARVDVDREQDLAARFGIRGIPSVKLFRDGELVDEFTGVQPEPNVRALLDRHVRPSSDDAVERAGRLLEAGRRQDAVAGLRQAVADDPGNERLYPPLVDLLIADGDAAGARETLQAAPPEIRETPALQSLARRVHFAGVAGDPADRAGLRERLEREPSDPEALRRLAAAAVLAGDCDEALEDLLGLLQKHPGYDDGAARDDLLAMFDLLGADDPRVRDARRRMALALH